jgi:hypothetical protein
MSKRTYYSFNKKPEGNGWITWNCPAEEIERAWRAFHLGHYKNKFSVLKINLNKDIFIVSQLKITSTKYRKEIKQKLNCKSMAEAVFKGIRFGYLQAEDSKNDQLQR